MNIRGVMVDGVWIEQPTEVKKEFLYHFRDRFDKLADQRVTIEMSYPRSISTEQQVDLERMVSKQELRTAVWDCGTDKSPGPNGFTFGFYRHFWSLIEKDVLDAVSHFFVYGDIPKGCNSSFIALISKVPTANLVKDFRPISLIGSVYKIIARIANRLVGVLGDIVNEVQSAFIAERQILDGPFILNEVLQWCKSKKKQSLIFKVDFEKAYDLVRWDFLDDVLKKFGFGHKWCNWIQTCLNSSRGSILVNGSPTEEFQFFKGLKQGDPLSPFLFILIMESLHLSFQWVVDAGMFKGLNLSHSLSLSHMFYEDDTVFVGGLGVSSLYALNRGLMFKWVWRFFNQKSSLWNNVIKAIHGVDGNVNKGNKFARRSCWSSIVNEVRLLKGHGVNIFDFMKLRLGNGETIKFWTDNCDKTRWVKYVPIKVNVFAWKVMIDALPTRFNLSRRGIGIQSTSCPICDCGVESTEHLIFRCSLIRQLGRKVLKWWNIPSVEVDSYEEWKVWILSLRHVAKMKLLIEGVWFTMWWYVWNYRNKLLFDDKAPTKVVLFDNIVSSSFHWCNSRCKASFGWYEWLKNSYLIYL
nr:RNA-directed DNA polymerase, eukaryota [Tanacetum cinerariifolium]